MKHKRKGPRFGISEEPGKFTKPENDALKAAGLDTSNLLYCCKSDMNDYKEFKDIWLCFDAQGLYMAEGTTEIVPKKKWRKNLEPKITIERITAIPIDEIDSILCEQYVSTGRLITKKNDELKGLTGFSIGKLEDNDNFSQVFNTYKEKGVIEIPPSDRKNEGKCKKCGAPCPPGKEYCKKHSKNSKTAIRLFKFFGGYIPQITVIISIALIYAVIAVYIPQISTRKLFDNIIANPNGNPLNEQIKALGTLVLTVFGIRFLNTFLSAIQQFITASIMPRVTYDIKNKIFVAMQQLSLSFYSSKQTGSLMERVVRDANNIYWFFVDGIPSIIIDSITVIGVITLMFIMSWKLTLIVLFSVPVIISILVLGDKLFRGMHHKTWLFSSKLSSMVSDNINGQKIIKAFSKENEEYNRFDDLNKEYKKAELKLNLFEATAFPLIQVVIIILSAVVLGVGGVMVAREEISTGTLLSFTVYLEMLAEPFDFLSWVSNWWSRCADSAQRVFEICDSEAEIKESPNAVGFDNLKGDIEIKELEFEYEPARPVIKNLNLEIHAGQMLGIVGKTGAGKTTIANLITRLYDAKKGNIKIDGIDVKELKLSELRKNIGLVSQDIFLFMGTIADNIRYAVPDAGMEEVIAAAKAASAHDFIMKLPDAYETYVGAGGRSLSGGEKQRISIARTIIQNPKILILDEATAAMDTETERNIQASITKLKKGRTTIAIAHRLSTLRDADMLAVINEGTLTEFGTFSELLKLKGEFYKQYKLQSEALKSAGILISDAENNSEENEDE